MSASANKATATSSSSQDVTGSTIRKLSVACWRSERKLTWRLMMERTREQALSGALTLITSGRMTDQAIGISTVIEAAEKFHTFLTADQQAQAKESPKPSESSSTLDSTPPPSKPKVTAPAQPDNPVDF